MLRRHILRKDDILDTNGDAMERSSLLWRYAVELARLLKNEVRIEVCPGVDGRIACRDAVEERFRILLNGQRAIFEFGLRLCCCEAEWFRGRHGWKAFRGLA